MSDNFQDLNSLDFNEKRRINLVRHMSVVIMVASGIYIVLILLTKLPVPPVLYLGAFAGGLISYFLGKVKLYSLAKLTALIITNVVVFAAASSETERTNIFLYFGATGLASLVVFGYKERWKGFLFVALSAILYLITRLTEFSFLPYRHFSEGHITLFFIINVMVFTYVSAYIIYVMLKMNFISESILKETNKRIASQNEELLKANAELDQFMYSTSHDIRAPLSSLKGLIGLSERTSDPSEMKEYLKMMNGSVNNLEKFTFNITDHYRNSRVEIFIEPINLKELLREVINSLTFDDATVKYCFNNNLTDQSILKTDRARLRIVLSNIISNSLKYRNPESELLKIDINYIVDDQSHIIEITDNGIGIGEEHLSKIFMMFYRASDGSQGSGLGLYIVKETIDKLKGKIEVTSTIGLGTTFRIELPKLEMAESERK